MIQKLREDFESLKESWHTLFTNYYILCKVVYPLTPEQEKRLAELRTEEARKLREKRK